MDTNLPAATGNNGNAQAPVEAQPAATAANAQAAAASPAQAQPSGPTPDDLVKAGSFEQSPQETAEIWQKKYAASSTEAKRFQSALEALRKEQGVKPVFDSKGNFKGFEAEDGFEHKAPEVKLPKFSDLSEKDKARLEDDPEGFFEDLNSRVADKLSKAFVRAKPTVDAAQKVEELSDADRSVALDLIGAAKLPNGEPKYDNFDSLIRPTVDRLMRDPSLPDAIRAATAKEPAKMAQLFASHAALNALNWSKYAQKTEATKQSQQKANQAASQQLPSGQGAVQVGTTKTPAQLHAESMAKALTPKA